MPKSDCFNIAFDIVSNDSGLSQNTVTVYANGEYLVSLTVNGTSGETLSFTREVKLSKGSAKLTVAYPEGKIEIKKSKYWEIFNKIQELRKSFAKLRRVSKKPAFGFPCQG